MLPLFLTLLSLLIPFSSACTTILVGKHASASGHPMVTHNNDCTDCDIRIAIVPSADHPQPSNCPIYPCKFSYPRFIGADRGTTYTADALHDEYASGPFNASVAIGHIQQVRHTYSYIDGSYPIANEHGLQMGESTCSARLVAYGRPLGDALWDVSTLMRVAMERCRTARCAIELMGKLAEEGGYYGANDPPESGSGLFEESGEAVTLIDADGEAWVFHILPDDTGRSAVWAAQRLKDDHFTLVANKFTIRSVNTSDSDNYLASANMREVAVRAGLWPADSDGLFDFSAAYAPDALDPVGWADRRVWHLFNKVAPSLKLESDRDEPYPFSVKVEHPLSLDAVTAMNRDHFEGTKFDLSVGPAAGPYNNPTRYDRRREKEYAGGYFERAISLHRTSYSYVGVSREGLEWPLAGVTWFAHHAPHSSLFVPLYTATQQLPVSWQRGTLLELQRDNAWWAFASVTNVAEKMYVHIQQDVTMEQRTREAEYQKLIEELDHKLASASPTSALAAVTDFTMKASQQAVDAWWQLHDRLMCKYRDGQSLSSATLPVNSDPLFYPVWWLQAVGYFVGEIPELHSDLQPPQPPHPEAGLPAPATATAQRTVSPHHPALGHSWERRTQHSSEGRSGGIRRPFERADVEREAGVGRRGQGLVDGRAVVGSNGSGSVGVGGGSGGGMGVVVWLLCLCCVLCCYVAFRAGRRFEQRKQYELIY